MDTYSTGRHTLLPEPSSRDLFPRTSTLTVRKLTAYGAAGHGVRVAWAKAQEAGVQKVTGRMTGMNWWASFLGLSMTWDRVEFVGPHDAIKEFETDLTSLVK